MWSATSSSNGMAYYMDFYLGSTSMRTFSAYKADARPVRCVKINASTPDDPTHEYVDLGLSVKWATCNVGATSPEDYGDYFAWGEISSKEAYNWSTYQWCNGSGTSLTKYNRKSNYGTVDNKTTLDLEDDAANAIWGGNWYIPTQTEMKELMSNSTAEWTTENGVYGCRFTSNKDGYLGQSVFLPAAGYRKDNSLLSSGSEGRYWSSWGHYDSPMGAHGLYLDSSDVYWGWGPYRYLGFSVRPVFITPVTSIQLSATSITLFKDNSQHLEATVFPENASRKDLIWASSDESIATVNEEGELTALSAGTTTISVSTIDGSGVSASCVIKVIDQPIPEAVDLGLSVKWASFNLGASKPEEFGEYFAWGETNTKSLFEWTTYQWSNGSSKSLTKYNTKATYGTVDNIIVLDPEDDAAHVILGNSWRIPTQEELKELQDNCNSEWTSLNGVSGLRFTSKKEGYTDKSIFFPAAGRLEGNSNGLEGSGGLYCSSSLHLVYPDHSYRLYFNSSEVSVVHGTQRHLGQSIRPVCE